MVFVQGSSYRLPIVIRGVDGLPIDKSLVSNARFLFGDIEKVYSESGEVGYDTNSGSFLVPLSAEDTSKFGNIVKMQISVTFVGGEVDNTKPQFIRVYESLEKAKRS